MLATSYFHERVSLAGTTLFFLVYLTRPRRQEIQAPSITCFAEDPPSERKAGPVDDDGYRPSSFFLFLFSSFFSCLSLSLSLMRRVRAGGGSFPSMTIVNSSIDLHRWPRTLIIFHGEFWLPFFFCFLLSCLCLNTSNKSTTNM